MLHAGRQWWGEHRELSLFSASLHDPLAERSRVQRHHCWPQEVSNAMTWKYHGWLPLFIIIVVSVVENRQIFTIWPQGHTRPSSPLTARSKQTSTRSRSFWRICSAPRGNATRRLYNRFTEPDYITNTHTYTLGHPHTVLGWFISLRQRCRQDRKPVSLVKRVVFN